MENNTAILNAKEKIVSFKFKDQMFAVDLTEGDLEDNWNSIYLKGQIFYFNFYWHPEVKPSLVLYPRCIKDQILETHYSEGIPFELTVKGKIGNYFKL
jgi:hypothetical protein